LGENRREVERAHHTEVIAFCSELLSLHCPRHPLLHALLPACADSQVFTRQDCPAYAGEPLHTVGLLEAAHQYSLQDMGRSTRTPIPTALSTQEWQFKNLQGPVLFVSRSNPSRIGATVQTGDRQVTTHFLPQGGATLHYKKNVSFAVASRWLFESSAGI
jgi:hypothetical protein